MELLNGKLIQWAFGVGVAASSMIILLSEQTSYRLVDTDKSQVLRQEEESSASRRDFIARFSGQLPLQNGQMVASRSSATERKFAADILVEELLSRNLQVSRHRYRSQNSHFLEDFVLPPVEGENIVASIPATISAAQTVIVGAHYDSEQGSPGADDNATGVAALISLAVALNEMEYRRFNFLFVFFDEEEGSGSGSKVFARKMLDEKMNVHSMHNVDMIGWDENDDLVVDFDIDALELEQLYREKAGELGIRLNKARFNSTDHVPFRNLGFVTACISENFDGGDYNRNFHTKEDRIGSVDFDYFESNVSLLTEVMRELNDPA